MVEPKITVEGTPNPNAAKFVLDRPVLEGGSQSYFDPAAAAENPLAARLFEVEGVRALFLADDFITVTKKDGVEWPDIVDRIGETIRTQLSVES